MKQQNKELYRNTCKKEIGIPIFHQPEWLDVACGINGWQVAIVAEGEKVIAALPYTLGKKWWLTLALMPPLTPYLGIWVDPVIKVDKKKYSKIVASLLQNLPANDLFAVRNTPGFTGSLDWIWQDWELESKYTLQVLPSEKIALEDLKGSLRNDIKKAMGGLVLKKSSDQHILYALMEKSFSRNKAPMPLTQQQFDSFHHMIQEKNVGEIWVAEQASGEVVAAHYFLWDQFNIYNWVSGYLKKENTRGATQMILHHGIQKAQEENKAFDFEGGLMPGIGNMYKSFPVTEVPYVTSRKFKNKWIKALWSLRG